MTDDSRDATPFEPASDQPADAAPDQLDAATAARLDAALAQLDPPHIPLAVAARIEAALRHESAARANSARAAVAIASPTPPAPEADRRGHRSRRWIWAAAGGLAAAGLAATAIVVQHADAPVPATVAGGQWAGVNTVPVSTGSDYTEANMDALIQKFVRSRELPVAQPSATANTFAASPSGLSACLGALGYSPDSLAMLDIARYGNRPVAVLAYLNGAGDRTADVLVVGTGCSATQPDVHLHHVTDMSQGSVG